MDAVIVGWIIPDQPLSDDVYSPVKGLEMNTGSGIYVPAPAVRLATSILAQRLFQILHRERLS